MRVLILYCKTGGGHKSSGLQIKNELEKRGHECIMMDPFSIAGDIEGDKLGNTYSNVIKVPYLFKCIYVIGRVFNNLFTINPVGWYCRRHSGNLHSYLKDNRFDYILCTHLYPVLMLDGLKRELNIPAYFYVFTDYTPIPFTKGTDATYYVIPSVMLVDRVRMIGIPENKILPFGIPVSNEFRVTNHSKDYIMISSGSIGGNRVYKYTKELKDRYNIIAVCGNDKKLYKKLSKLHSNNELEVLYQCSNISSYLCRSKIFIGKPGGLSTTEVLHTNTHLVLFDYIPGVESENRKFLVENKLAYRLPRGKRKRLKLIDELYIKECMRESGIVNKNSAKMLIDYLEREGAM